MRVKLSSTVVFHEVQRRLVDVARPLRVGRRLEDLQTGDGSCGEDASAVTRLRAVCGYTGLDVADGVVGGRARSAPEAEAKGVGAIRRTETREGEEGEKERGTGGDKRGKSEVSKKLAARLTVPQRWP